MILFQQTPYHEKENYKAKQNCTVILNNQELQMKVNLEFY